MPVKIRAVALSLLLSLSSASLASLASAKDVPGAADHPALGRYEGASIAAFSQKAYEEIALPSGPLEKGQQATPSVWQSDFSGKLTSIRYEGPAGRSILEVMRNYEAALKASGLEIKFFCRGRAQCAPGGALPTFWQAAAGEVRGIPSAWDSTVYLLAEGKGADGPVTVALLGVEHPVGKDKVMTPVVAATVIDGKPMESDKIKVVAADDMARAIARDGRIAIYGIYFDFDKADIQPQSQPQIDQLGALMKSHPELKVLVVGHTDGQGAFDYNLTLSQRRAQAVVDALVSGQGVARVRLTPAGAGMVAPVASNRTEAGRAKNRRVEIVEIVPAK